MNGSSLADTPIEWVRDALYGLERAKEKVSAALNTLQGPERSEGMRMAVEAMGATEVARALGVSRQRVYQLMGER